jgi:GTP pyrophosphokinase
MDNWLTKIQEILGSDNLNSLELLDLIQEDIVTREVVVFTPKGDQKSITKGSTALDFAYKVHTKVGNHAIAAKINMRLAPLSHVLKSGDQVEIITARKATPKLEWLTFLHTRSAKHKLLDWIRANDTSMLAEAEKMLAKESNVAVERARIPLMISLQGINRPGLQEEIESALKRIDGIEDVVISDL